MTPERMREAAQILGELGNGKMANELESLARKTQKESGKVRQGALAAVAALQQVERPATDRANQRKQINDLQRVISELEPRAAFGDQCYQDRCENAYVEQSVADREAATTRNRAKDKENKRRAAERAIMGNAL